MRMIMFAVFALWAGAAQAAVIHIKPRLAKVYDQEFNDITHFAVVHYDPEDPWVRLAITSGSVESLILQVDYSLAISDLQAGQLGFGNARFNLGFDMDLSPSSSRPGWYPEVGVLIDSNGAGPGGVRDKWAANGDYGASGDLRKIIVGTDPPDFGPINVDPRRRFGQDRDEYFGSVFVETARMMTNTIGKLSVKRAFGSVYDTNNQLLTDDVTVAGQPLHFLVGVPEPSSTILLALGGAILAACGRHFQR